MKNFLKHENGEWNRRTIIIAALAVLLVLANVLAAVNSCVSKTHHRMRVAICGMMCVLALALLGCHRPVPVPAEQKVIHKESDQRLIAAVDKLNENASRRGDCGRYRVVIIHGRTQSLPDESGCPRFNWARQSAVNAKTMAAVRRSR